MTAITIAFANQKGGVAKTTSTANVGAELVRKGHRVLLVDMDGQGSLTYLCGYNYESFSDGDSLPAILIPDAVKRGEGILPLPTDIGPDLLPANPTLQDLDLDLPQRSGSNHRLKTGLQPFLDDYDFVLIDSGPKLGATTMNALVAADYVLVPIKANAMSLRGLMALVNSIDLIRQYEPDADPEILGTFATQVKDKTRKALEATITFQKLDREHGLKYLGLIRNSVKVEEADDSQISIRAHKKDSKPAVDYANLTTQILKTLEQKEPAHA